ncbi:hypothetical protein B0A49_12452, partial [Cryomyces minteri]
MPQGQLAPRDDTEASLRDATPTTLRNIATQRSNIILPNRSDPRSQRVITPSPLQSSQTSNPPAGVDSRPTSASPRSPAFPTYGNLLQARSPLQGSLGSQDQKLLDDNAKISAHNATMWRLLEKQRELIKGLNKDLERAGKDKERFRKKLKDHLVQSASSQPPLDMKYRADTMSERGNTPSPALSDRRVDPLEMARSQASQIGDQAAQNRQIFGIPLAEAVEISPPIGVDVYLPAVIYRCIEYLHAKHATSEEGIFRLSGSNVVIKELKARFHRQGDVKLLDGQYYDVHAVASLLKQYLRDLPSSILTRDLHIDFLRVLDIVEQDKKIAAFAAL